MKTHTVYLNGEYQAAEAAKVSVFDRGFIFGDGVYEVIPVFGRRLFRLPQHLARLDSSLREVRIPDPLTPAQWREVLGHLVDDVSEDDQSVYLQVTRGVAPRDHAFPADIKPTVFAYAQALKHPSAEQLAQGVGAITVPDMRWQRCDIKAIALLPNILMRQQAIDAGAAEAILVRDGFVTEGAACNIFIVRDGRAITPPTGPHILPGITRDLVLELMQAHGVAHELRSIREHELRTADEIWLTSSGKEIMPITRLDAKPVGTGKPGPLGARVLELYRDYKRAFCEGKVT
jgi:D-alanine transaminase